MFYSAFLLLFVTGFANSCNLYYIHPTDMCEGCPESPLWIHPDLCLMMGCPDTARNKRSAEGCAEFELKLTSAIKFCPHGSDDGFTRAEVENCWMELYKYKAIVDTEEGFEEMDENSDGVLTVKEWKQFVGC
eukprot:GFUD01101589.1.p1 GENE.GFUD01101589.1~~GFUD01101589.1.p1  ORF type:complete len:132 (-),score=11.59 GFUD01101589.1:15-410(-)